MNGGSDPVGNYSEDLAAFQEVLPKRYQILREVGRGGMGQVLLAIDRGPNLDRHRMVAIKRMLGSYLGDLESVKRFYDEIDLASDLRHPNVVKMYHSDETRLGPYIVMEYIEGKDLGVYIQERGPLSEPQAVVWFTKLAEALDEGHRKGLIHRDIKPNNILISQEGEPYLTDFGIARRISAMDKTGTGLGTGTIEYMSLEQLRNSRSESSQDIYSFGATLFHAVEGRPPFESTNLVDFITKLASESAPRATRVSTKLADRIASCLAKNPVERPSTCQAVLAGMVADPIAVPVVAPPKAVEKKPEPFSQPVARRQSVPRSVEQLPQRRFALIKFSFIVFLGLFLWWLAVSGSWNRDVGRTKNDLAMESSPSKEVVAPTVDSSAAMSDSKKDVEPAKTEPKVPSAPPKNELSMESSPSNESASPKAEPSSVVSDSKKDVEPSKTELKVPSTPPKNELSMESSPSNESASPKAEPSSVVSDSKKNVEPPKTEPKGPSSPTEQITNSLGMHFRKIQPGKFMMGAPANEASGSGPDQTQHSVTLTKAYYICVYEVTQEEYEGLMGNNPSQFTAKRNPVENVTYDDAEIFIGKLNALAEERSAGRVYRLPTEAEWEYACRAGISTAYCFGQDNARLGEYAWYDANSESKPHPVGEKSPNAWGLYDMHGNVLEWCSDWYQNYPRNSVTDPTGPSRGFGRIFRGGSYAAEARICRSYERFRDAPSIRYPDLGFRLVLSSQGASK